ncbi:MAG: oligosaccharyl transferase, archaeosortase A system-associated [Halobacteriales archaeon]|nr:oligosaccharyl transferase, archaeosortase A system-associated [Halobacteriales archaeon]
MDSEKLEKYVPHFLLTVVFVYMAWIRTLPYSDVVGEDGVTFSANDPWYHIRTVEYLVENYPAVFPFDPWTNFPYGSTSSTGYGGLFDQIIATVAIIVGLGDPSARQVELVTAFAPVFFGAATAIPVYLLAKKLTDRWVALLSAFSLALFGGQWLNRTTFSNAQHQSAEAFFVAVAVLAFVIAVERAYSEKPTVAHLKDLDLKPFTGAFLGGIGLALYLLTWTPGIYIAVPLGLFVVVQMIRDHLNGRSTEYLALSSFFVFVIAAVPFLIYTFLLGHQYKFSGTGFSMLQPTVLFVTGVGSLLLYFISSYLQKDEQSKAAFPAVVVGLFAVGFAVLWLTGLISLFENLVSRMYSFGRLTSGGALTVAEIQPPNLTNAIEEFGLLIIVAAAGLAILLVDVVRKNSPAKMAALFWSINMFTAYFTQARFGYYLAVASAVLVAYAVYRVVELADLEEMEMETMEDLKKIKGYQIIALVLIVFLFLPVNVVAVGNNPNMQPAWNSVSAGGDEPWQEEALPWMNDNTPDISMEYNEGWTIPQGEDFDYNVAESPLEGDYGVMSWWDYGHWITHVGERVPNANPFQEGNIVGSLFFTSQSEERADLLLEALPSVGSGQALEGMSNEELREIVENQDTQERYEDTRYVIIDDQMAAGKFGAIATWTNFEYGTEQREFFMNDGTQQTLPALDDRYENTTLSRLYYDDASGMSGYRLVHETETYSLIGSFSEFGTPTAINRLVTRGQYDDQDALGGNLSISGVEERFPEDQMLPLTGGTSLYDVDGVASVKTFERVEGATITGQANTTGIENAVAITRMNTTNTGRTFNYVKETETDENGNFEITVPYPTVDDVSLEEGGTDSSVRAEAPFNIYVGENASYVEAFGQSGVVAAEEQALVDVNESDVYMGNEIESELEEAETIEDIEGGEDDGGTEDGGETDSTQTEDAAEGGTDNGETEETDGGTGEGEDDSSQNSNATSGE